MLLNLELLDKETRSLIWVLVYSTKIIFVNNNFCNCTKFYHEVRLYIFFTIRYELKYNA